MGLLCPHRQKGDVLLLFSSLLGKAVSSVLVTGGGDPQSKDGCSGLDMRPCEIHTLAPQPHAMVFGGGATGLDAVVGVGPRIRGGDQSWLSPPCELTGRRGPSASQESVTKNLPPL